MVIFMVTVSTKSKPTSPQTQSRPASQPTGSCLELQPIPSCSTTPHRILNEEGSNEILLHRPASASQELPGSATRTTTPNTSPNNTMRRFSRTGIHPMLGAGLAIREAFGESL